MEKKSMWLISKRPGLEPWNPPFHFNWSNEKLWALKLPVHKVHIKRLNWMILKPIWSTKRGRDLRNLVPFDVIRYPEVFPRHYERIMAADLQYPIDCMWIDGRFYILDGVHRLAKIMMGKRLAVRIRKLKNLHIDLIRK